MTVNGRDEGMREQLNENLIVGIVDPSVRNAIEVFQAVLGMRPQAPLKSICGRITVPHFTHIIVGVIVEPINGVFSTVPRILADNSRRLPLRLLIVKNEDVAPLLLLVLNEGENI